MNPIQVHYPITSGVGIVKCPLYHSLAGQPQPAPAHLVMSVWGKVWARHDTFPDEGTPEDVLNRRTLRWSLSPQVDGRVVDDKVRSPAFREILQTVHDGHTFGWEDGVQFGRLTPRALSAYDRVADELRALPTVDVWRAAEWVREQGIFQMWPRSHYLDDAVDRVADSADAAGIFIEDDISAGLMSVCETRLVGKEHLHTRQLLALRDRGGLHDEDLVTLHKCQIMELKAAAEGALLCDDVYGGKVGENLRSALRLVESEVFVDY